MNTTTAAPTATTEAPTLSWAEDAAQGETATCRAVVLAVIGTAVVVTVVSRIAGVIVARGHAAEHLEHQTPEALERARAAHYHVMHAGHNPMVALLVAALQPVYILQNTFFLDRTRCIGTATARILIPAECSAVPLTGCASRA